MCEELKLVKTSIRKYKQRVGAELYDDKMLALSEPAQRIVVLIERGAPFEDIIEALVLDFQRGWSSVITPQERQTAVRVFVHEIATIRETFDV